ncbi:hypothetical protein EsH8_V_000694 [Colletotrichum jinshuiense]
MSSQEAAERGSSPDPDPAEFLNDPRFHQTFTLPAGPNRPHPFQVTYSDYGYRNVDDPSREHVMLLCGPLLGSRYLHIAKDELAKKYGVRIINPDRPGFGGTSEVGVQDRVRVWLEMVPALLEHLGVRHISVASHSCGTIYALNTLLHLRHLLSPTRPYVGLCTPWVRPSRSGITTMTLAGGLPDAVLGKFHAVAGFFNRSVGPAVEMSSVAFNRLLPSPQATPPTAAPGPGGNMAKFEQRLWEPLFKRVYSENTQGLSQDVILLLKRGGDAGYWGAWQDYDTFVPLLANAERSLAAGAAAAAGAGASKLRVEVFFSEQDHLIGTKDGPKWFDHCWRAEQRGDEIEYTSCVVPGTEHDYILRLGFDVFERMLRQIAGTDQTLALA